MWKWVVMTLASATLAAIFTLTTSSKQPFEEVVQRAALTEEARTSVSKCPLSAERIEKDDITTLSICEQYGLIAYESALRYPKNAFKVFEIYGGESVYREILDRYGHVIVPVVAYFLEKGSREFQLREVAGGLWDQLVKGKRLSLKEIPPLSNEQIGLVAIHEIARRGHELLAEFVIVGDEARRLPGTRILFAAKDMMLGSVTNIEAIMVRGERLPTLKEVGAAALDVVLIAGGVGAILKGIKTAGKTAALSKGATVRAAGAGAVKAIVAVGKVTVTATPFAVGYVAITRPKLLSSAAGWVAEQAGFNPVLAVYLMWFGIIWIILWILWFLTAPIRWALKPLRVVRRLVPSR